MIRPRIHETIEALGAGDAQRWPRVRGAGSDPAGRWQLAHPARGRDGPRGDGPAGGGGRTPEAHDGIGRRLRRGAAAGRVGADGCARRRRPGRRLAVAAAAGSALDPAADIAETAATPDSRQPAGRRSARGTGGNRTVASDRVGCCRCGLALVAAVVDRGGRDRVELPRRRVGRAVPSPAPSVAVIPTASPSLAVSHRRAPIVARLRRRPRRSRRPRRRRGPAGPDHRHHDPQWPIRRSTTRSSTTRREHPAVATSISSWTPSRRRRRASPAPSKNWILYDGPVPFTGYRVSDRPAGANQMCVLVARHGPFGAAEHRQLLRPPRLATAGPMTDLATEVRAIAALAGEAARGTDQAAAVDAVTRRLDEPLRVAIAGRVKAGKSTLLNALVGERLAATDAGECTRIVTWYRHGLGYRVTADLRPTGQARAGVPATGRRARTSTSDRTRSMPSSASTSAGRRRSSSR